MGLIFALFGLFLYWTAVAQPAELSTQPAYQEFTAGKKILYQKALAVPGSPFGILLVAVRRTEDVANWSQDPADGIHARLFAYRLADGQIDSQQTELLNQQVGAEKFYDFDHCGGLGSLRPENFAAQDNKLLLTRYYAAGTVRANCSDEIVFFNGKLLLQKQRTVDTGISAMVAQARKELHLKALQLYQQGNLEAALQIWEQLYSYWQYGPHATAGPVEEVLNNLGFVYYKLGNFSKAEELLLECRKNFPEKSIVVLNLADLYRDSGQLTEASKYYRQFLQFPHLSEEEISYAKKQLELLKK